MPALHRARPGVGEHAKRDYRTYARLHLGELADLPLASVTPELAGRWVATLAAGHLAPKTVRNVVGFVSSVFADASRNGLVPANPFDAVRSPKAATAPSEMVFLTPSEFAFLLGHIHPHYQALVRTLAGTGMRWGEATALRARDVDVVAGRVSITRAWKRQPGGAFVIGEPKTARSRRVVTIPAAVAEPLTARVVSLGRDELLFTNTLGDGITHSTFWRGHWTPAVMASVRCAHHRAQDPAATKPCGCPGMLEQRPRIHDLRHSHASWLIAAGVPLPAIQRRLGHTSITTTIDRYGHLMPELDQAMVIAVDAALAPAASAL